MVTQYFETENRQEMDDLESRQTTGISQLDRKIASLSSLRDQWCDTESILQSLSGSLKNLENELAQLEDETESTKEPKFWYEKVSNLEQKICAQEALLVESEDAIVQFRVRN